MNNKQWLFKEKDGSEVTVPLEKWIWRVVYKDDTEIFQFDQEPDETGKHWFHQIGEVDMDNAKIFEMINVENPELRYSIDVTDDMKKLIVFIRRTVLKVTTKQEQRVNVYCFGYKINGTSVYNFILPDNRLVISTNRNIQLIST